MLSLLFSIKTSAQNPDPDFSQDVRVDTSLNNYFRMNRHTSDPRNERFIRDFSGASLSQSTLFQELDLSAYELLSANLSFSDKDQIQKVVFSPFRIARTKYEFLDWLKVNIVQKKDITTFGAGFGYDNTTLGTTRRSELLDKTFTLDSIPSPRRPNVGEAFDVYEKVVLIPYKEKFLDSLSLNFYEALAESVFKFTIGYNQQFFSILGASSTTAEFDSLNYYGTKANNVTATLSQSWNNGQTSISGGYNYIFSRASAAKTQEKISYNSFTVAISRRIWTFIKDREQLRAMDAYKKSLFVPGVLFGVSWDLKKTEENDFKFIEQGIKRNRVWTPFLDIMITPAAQFRIGVPIQRATMVDGSKQTVLGANVQYALRFSNLN